MGFGSLIESVFDAAGGNTPDVAGEFTIVELRGQSRSIILRGRGLPYPPFELGVDQRIVTTWNPGYGQATATVLGSQDRPTTINGMWKDRFIQKPATKDTGSGITATIAEARKQVVAISGALSGGFGEDAEFKAPVVKDGEDVPSVRDVVELFDSVLREGQLLEVRWDIHRRHGFLRSFVPSWLNVHDVEWEMTFDWIGKGENIDVVAETESVATVYEELVAATEDIEAILDEADAIVDELDDRVTSTLQSLVELVDMVKGAVNTVQRLVNLPSSAMRRTAATLNSIIARGKEISDDFESMPFALQHRDSQRADSFGSVTVRSAALGQSGTAGNVNYLSPRQVSAVSTISSASIAHRIKRAVRSLISTAAFRRAQIFRTLQTQLQDVYQAREGEDLRDVAARLYNDSGEWKRLMLYNGLTTPVLNGGQVILVPKVSAEGFCASILP